MTTKFATQACEETFFGVEPMLNVIVKQIYRQYGCDWEELQAEARLGFMLAYVSFDQSRSVFTTWCWFHVWGRLMDYVSKPARRAAIAKSYSLYESSRYDEIQVSWDEATELKFNRADVEDRLGTDVEDRLGADARVVLRLALSAPAEAIRETVDNGQMDRRAARAALRGYLRDMGWAACEITSAFTEIKFALGWERPSMGKFVREVQEEV